MATEKRLVYASDVRREILSAEPRLAYIVDRVKTVDAVEASKYEAVVCKYEALVGMYHELRENFVDYYCSGTPNVAPYCLNKCEGCVTPFGWCKISSEKCRGFNPAEVILDRYAKMDGDGNE